MGGDRAAQIAWVARVFGVTFGPSDTASGSQSELDLSQITPRLQEAAEALNALRSEAAPETPDLLAQYQAVVADVKAGAAGAPQALDDLEASLARARSASRAREAFSGKRRSVVFGKLLLRWRDAQKKLADNLEALGAALLARKDIQADPRIAQIKQGVAALPKLVPNFGGELEAVLDAGLNARTDPELSALAGQGIAAVKTYREKLEAAAHLLELEKFAEEDLGQGLALHAELDAALVELQQELATQA